MSKFAQLRLISRAFVFFAITLSLATTSCKKSDGSDSGSTTGGSGGSTTDETETGLVLVSPNFPTDNQEMTLTFDAARGNGALSGTSGDVYLYAGVITDKSTSPTSWRYIKNTSFTTAVSELKMTSLGNNKFKITFTPRAFFGVPSDEKILKIAMLFRSADGSVVGRNLDGTDIYTSIYESTALQLKFALPEFHPTYIPKPIITVDVGGQVFIKALSSRTANLTLSLNGQSFATASNATSIKGTAKITTSGIQKIKIAANENGTLTEQTIEFIVNGTPNVQALPFLATKDGVNVLGGSSVILNLFAPNKSSVYVIGDFNNWQLDNAYAMKRTPDGSRWWLQLDNLSPQAEYAYQYVIDGEIRVADPYTEKVLDPSDSFITPSVYPDLKAYPAGKTTGIVSTFSTTQSNYNWQIANFNRPAKSDLVVYEMLVRDFVTEHTYAAAIAKLDYLKNLGINAVELMPVNEFEGNSSWGYNTNFYFAPDKYYGTKNALKNFIDECHKRGMAVILDVVLNHSFGSSPMVQMYYDKVNNRPSSSNPWYNSTDRHPFGVGFDFNHESAATKAFAKNVMRFWMQEYKVDGYRFDLSKGFTQNFTNDVNAWSNYDASRIAIWKEYNAFMKSLDSDFYVILEHFAADAEEKELAADGMLLWNNMHGSYGEATMGWLANSNFSRSFYDLHGFTSTSADKLVTYMESHDEERIIYKNLNFGNVSGSYTTKSLATALKRKEMAAAFLFASPGPKMIWQFGELGYDVNIDFNGRTGEKPIRWNYATVAERKALYDAMAKMIRLKTGNSVFRTTNFSYSLTGAIKYIRLVGANMSVVVVGNFDVNNQTANFSFPANGTWYDYMNPGQTITINGNYVDTLSPGEYHIYTSINLN